MRRRIEGALARSLLRLPAPWVRRLAGRPIQRSGRTLDPQVQLSLALARIARKPHSHEIPLEAARRQMDEMGTVMSRPQREPVEVRDDHLAERPARIYRPPTLTGNSPAVLYFHGGGYVVGSLDSHDAPCRELAARLPATVVSVDYRLAPEHPFPAALDDGVAAFAALVDRAAALQVDPQRIAIAGDSAGGNLTAEVALATREHAVRPRFQMLIYPVTDMTMSMASIEEMGSGFFLERETMIWFRRQYLNGHDPEDPRVTPLFADNLENLPPALVITAGFDPLRDEGDAYAARLREAGVEVAHHQHPSLFHGFWNTTGVIREAERAFDEAVGVLRAQLCAP